MITTKDLGITSKLNILKPVKCECGCGGYMNLMLETEQDVIDFLGTVIVEDDCDRILGVAIRKDEYIVMEQISETEVQPYFLKKNLPLNAIGEMFKTLDFHCYAIIEEVEDGAYRFVTDKLYDKRRD